MIINVTVINQPITKSAAVKMLALKGSIDCALPANWLQSAVEKTGREYGSILGNIVWNCDDNIPLPLTVEGCGILIQLNENQDTAEVLAIDRG